MAGREAKMVLDCLGDSVVMEIALRGAKRRTLRTPVLLPGRAAQDCPNQISRRAERRSTSLTPTEVEAGREPSGWG